MSVPAGKELVVVDTASGGAGATTMLTAAVAEPPEASAALTVKLKVPDAPGVPEIVLPERLNPPGKVPAEIVQVYGVTPPVAVRFVV